MKTINTYVIWLIFLCILLLTFLITEDFLALNKPKKVKSHLALDEIKKSMIKMGPYYQYRLLQDGTLQVNKGDGKWLNLKY